MKSATLFSDKHGDMDDEICARRNQLGPCVKTRKPSVDSQDFPSLKKEQILELTPKINSEFNAEKLPGPKKEAGLSPCLIIFQGRGVSCITFLSRLEPIGSMYGIFTYIYYKSQANVGKYPIYGSYGTLVKYASDAN